MPKAIEKVLIIFAMQSEAKPLVTALKLAKDEPSRVPPPAPCITFSGKYKDLDIMLACNEVTIKEMEVAAIAWSARFFKTPLTAVKAITDIVDDNSKTQEAFLQNFQLATKNLEESMMKVIEFIIGKSTADL